MFLDGISDGFPMRYNKAYDSTSQEEDIGKMEKINDDVYYILVNLVNKKIVWDIVSF